jgi:histone H3/H4
MKNLIIKNNIKGIVKELDKDNSISSVAGDVAIELQKKAEELLEQGIKRAKANNRRTLFGRDL